MKVLNLSTGKTEEYNDSYAMRLIEQGRAVPAPAEKKTDARKPHARKE